MNQIGSSTDTKQKDLSNIASWPSFKKVCDVRSSPGILWDYINIDRDLMYADHRSWVYFIVVNGTIYKVGETSLQLGIENRYGQPLCNTNNRFGRYRRQKDSDRADTDEVIRLALRAQVVAGQVELWAMQCEEVAHTFQLGGSTITVSATVHSPLEKRILDVMLENGHWPSGNKLRG